MDSIFCYAVGPRSQDVSELLHVSFKSFQSFFFQVIRPSLVPYQKPFFENITLNI